MSFVLPDEADGADGARAAGGDGSLAQLLVAWVTSDNWGDSRKFLAEHADKLMTDAGEMTIQRLMDANPDQEVLGLHQELLEASRIGGIDAAYDAIDESIRRFAIAERLVAWVSTQSWDEARAFYEANVLEFDTDDAEVVLDELVDDNPGQPDLLAHQGLLSLIRLDGADFAFSILNETEALGDLVTSSANRADPVRAIPRARLLAGLYPDNLGAQLALATTALILGDQDEARRAIARCAESLPQNQRAELAVQLGALADAQPELAPGLIMLKDSLG